MFQNSYPSCFAAFEAGSVKPEPGKPVTILLTTNQTVNCSMENIEGGTTSCPDGWYGSMDRNFCFKVNMKPVNNEEACRLESCKELCFSDLG